MRVGVITFPRSLDDRDAARAVRLAGVDGCFAIPLAELAGGHAQTLPALFG